MYSYIKHGKCKTFDDIVAGKVRKWGKSESRKIEGKKISMLFSYHSIFLTFPTFGLSPLSDFRTPNEKMTKTELIKQITAIIGKPKVLELSRILKEQRFALDDMIDITFHADKAVSFRAVWILENVFLTDPESYLPSLNYLIERFKDVKHQSCMRHYAKIIMHITAPDAPASLQIKLKEIDFEPVVEQLFDWMI
ncbi:MAG TPA: hypothetical protein VIM77_09890, partial [Mucilaginibacter sp.]